MKKVVCSHAGKKLCTGVRCKHFAPHEEFVDNVALCTTPGPCWDDYGEPLYRAVVCKPVKQGKKNKGKDK